jgi:DNA/RNA endonuclease G (NUC1)
VTWSVDPATPFATVDAEGVVTGIAQGTATIRATRVSDGAVATYSLPVANPPDGPAAYGNHLEFGRPVALSPRDEIAVAWPEFSASYNPLRGQSNWIAYNLDSDDRGPADRCECFTHDPSLPGSVPVISTDDYTSSGYSRGHLVMSEDRTSGGSSSTPVQTSIDNARTFLFSNIIPQTSANNGGPWLDLESHLGALATTGGKEVYILAGGAAYSGTLKNEGKVAIPTRTWKVAVILPDGQGLSSIDDPSDFEVIAVDMPNATSGLSSSWETYRVTVDQVEALIGYDLLAALPDAIECRVEQAIAPVANCAPEAAIQTTAISGRTVTVAARFRDGETTDGPWRLSINWGDGTAPTTATSFVQTWNAPLSRAHTYAAGGTYTITLTVVDKGGRTTTTQTQVTIP